MISYNPTDPDIEGKKKYDIMKGFGIFLYIFGLINIVSHIKAIYFICLLPIDYYGVIAIVFSVFYIIGSILLVSAGRSIFKTSEQAPNKALRAFKYILIVKYVYIVVFILETLFHIIVLKKFSLEITFFNTLHLIATIIILKSLIYIFSDLQIAKYFKPATEENKSENSSNIVNLFTQKWDPLIDFGKKIRLFSYIGLAIVIFVMYEAYSINKELDKIKVESNKTIQSLNQSLIKGKEFIDLKESTINDYEDQIISLKREKYQAHDESKKEIQNEISKIEKHIEDIKNSKFKNGHELLLQVYQLEYQELQKRMKSLNAKDHIGVTEQMLDLQYRIQDLIITQQYTQNIMDNLENQNQLYLTLIRDLLVAAAIIFVISLLLFFTGTGVVNKKEWGRLMTQIIHILPLFLPLVYFFNLLNIHDKINKMPFTQLLLLAIILSLPVFYWCYFVIRSFSNPILKYVFIRGGNVIE